MAGAGARHSALVPAKGGQLSRALGHAALEEEVSGLSGLSGLRGVRVVEAPPLEAAKLPEGQRGRRRNVGSLALCDSPFGEEGSLEDIVKRLEPANVKTLAAVAHKRSRRALRCLSYPALPPERERSRREEAKTALARARRVPERPAEQRKATTLERALAVRRDALELRDQVIAAAQPLAEDLATDTCTAGGGSLEWVDLPSLSKAVEAEAAEWRSRQEDSPLQPSFSAPVLIQPALTSLPGGGDERAGHAGGADEPEQPLLMTKWPSLQRRSWPDMDTFERHYRPPHGLQSPPRRPVSHEREPLPSGRKTIAGIEEATSFGSQAYLWPELLNYSGQQTAGQQDQAQPASDAQRARRQFGLFEAAAMYRTTCKEMGVAPLERPVPIFSSERVEISESGQDIGTRQCYAIAKTIRVCAPREIALRDACLSDQGCAEIVEVGIASGQLRAFRASGCWLGSRTCAALHRGLRTRGAASLVELRLSACGLGGNLEEEVSELEASTSAAYLRSLSALMGSIESRGIPSAEGWDAEGAEALLSNEGAGESAEKAKGGEPEGEPSEEPLGEQPSLPAEPTPLLLPLLAQLARPGCMLRTLELSKSAMSLATAKLLGKVLATAPLEALMLNHCNIHDHSLLVIAEGLRQNRLLLELHLRGNKFSGHSSATAVLLDAAGRHARLAHLDIADNLLTNRCVEELCAALRWSCSLVAIHLLSADILIPDAPSITAACRKWLAENTFEGGLQVPGSLEAIAAPGDHTPALEVTLSAAPGASPAAPANKEEGDGENPPAEELVLCRALHVEGLGSWRLASPEPKNGPSPLTPMEEDEKAPRSWMPSCCWVCSRCSPVDYKWVVPDCGEGSDTGDRAARIFVRPSFANFGRVELKRKNIAGAKRVQYGARLLVPPGSHSHIFEAMIPGNLGSKTEILHACGEPSVELGEAGLSDSQREVFESLCRQNRCSVRLNIMQSVKADGFQIPESTANENAPESTIGDWEDDPERVRRFRQCYETDLRELHLSDLCHAEEEDEVLETLWELYPRFYETYAAYAGRSQWPLVRHVDVYGFFDDSGLLIRMGPLAALVPESGGGSPLADAEGMQLLQLELQDVQQMILQTFATVQRKRTGRRRSSADPRRSSSAGSLAIAAAGASDGPGAPDSLSSWAATVQQRTREGAPITRPQFIEVLLRAAIALCGGHPSTARAFRKFADCVISGRVMQPPLSPFPRGLPLQAGEVADTLLARRKVLKEGWERFGGSESAFQRLAQLMKLCDRSFTAKHVASIYAIARRPQADFRETGRRSQGLRYDEFCEAVARLALVWQRTQRSDASGHRRKWPPQPQVGRPVRQIAVAGRIEAFLSKLAERMRPSIMPSSLL